MVTIINHPDTTTVTHTHAQRYGTQVQKRLTHDSHKHTVNPTGTTHVTPQRTVHHPAPDWGRAQGGRVLKKRERETLHQATTPQQRTPPQLIETTGWDAAHGTPCLVHQAVKPSADTPTLRFLKRQRDRAPTPHTAPHTGADSTPGKHDVSCNRDVAGECHYMRLCRRKLHTGQSTVRCRSGRRAPHWQL